MVDSTKLTPTMTSVDRAVEQPVSVSIAPEKPNNQGVVKEPLAAGNIQSFIASLSAMQDIPRAVEVSLPTASNLAQSAEDTQTRLIRRSRVTRTQYNNAQLAAKLKAATAKKDAYQATDDATSMDVAVVRRTRSLEAGEEKIRELLRLNALNQGSTLGRIERFQRTTTAAYMAKSLALQYQRTLLMKDLFALTQTIGATHEAKLEAIKLNTSVAEVNKRTLFDMMREAVMKKAIERVSKGVVDWSEKTALPWLKDNYVNPIQSRVKEHLNADNDAGRAWKSIKQNVSNLKEKASKRRERMVASIGDAVIGGMDRLAPSALKANDRITELINRQTETDQQVAEEADEPTPPSASSKRRSSPAAPVSVRDRLSSRRKPQKRSAKRTIHHYTPASERSASPSTPRVVQDLLDLIPQNVMSRERRQAFETAIANGSGFVEDEWQKVRKRSKSIRENLPEWEKKLKDARDDPRQAARRAMDSAEQWLGEGYDEIVAHLSDEQRAKLDDALTTARKKSRRFKRRALVGGQRTWNRLSEQVEDYKKDPRQAIRKNIDQAEAWVSDEYNEFKRGLTDEQRRRLDQSVYTTRRRARRLRRRAVDANQYVIDGLSEQINAYRSDPRQAARRNLGQIETWLGQGYDEVRQQLRPEQRRKLDDAVNAVRERVGWPAVETAEEATPSEDTNADVPSAPLTVRDRLAQRRKVVNAPSKPGSRYGSTTRPLKKTSKVLGRHKTATPAAPQEDDPGLASRLSTLSSSAEEWLSDQYQAARDHLTDEQRERLDNAIAAVNKKKTKIKRRAKAWRRRYQPGIEDSILERSDQIDDLLNDAHDYSRTKYRSVRDRLKGRDDRTRAIIERLENYLDINDDAESPPNRRVARRLAQRYLRPDQQLGERVRPVPPSPGDDSIENTRRSTIPEYLRRNMRLGAMFDRVTADEQRLDENGQPIVIPSGQIDQPTLFSMLQRLFSQSVRLGAPGTPPPNGLHGTQGAADPLTQERVYDPLARISEAIEALRANQEAWRGEWATAQTSLIDAIHAVGTGPGGGGGGPSPAAGGSWLQRSRGWIAGKLVRAPGAALKGAWWATKKSAKLYTTGTLAGVRGGLSAISGIAGAGAHILTGRGRIRPFDIYRADKMDDGPIMTAKQFKSGVVYEDGTPVRNITQIDRPVFDARTRDPVITQEDIEAGLVDSYERPIRHVRGSGLIGAATTASLFGIRTAGRTIGALGGVYGNALGTGFRVLGMAGRGAWRAGRAIGRTGIVGRAASGLTNMSLSVLGASARAGAGLIGAASGAAVRGLGSLWNGGGGGGGGANRKDLEEVIGDRLDDILDILVFMKEQKNVAGDNDGDGIRDGSYEDYKKKLAAKREKRQQDAAARDGGRGGLLGRGRGALSSLARMLGLGGGAAAAGDGGGGGFGLGDAAGAVGDLFESRRGGGGGAPGRPHPHGPGAPKPRARFGRRAALAGAAALGAGLLYSGAANAFSGSHDEENDDEEKPEAPSLPINENVINGAVTASSAVGAASALRSIGTAEAATAASVAAKPAASMLGKMGAKLVPGLGVALGVGFGWSRLMDGDIVGASAEVLSGLVSTVPVYGTAAALAIQTGLGLRDMFGGKDIYSKLVLERMNAYGIDDEKLYPYLLELEKKQDEMLKVGAKYSEDDYRLMSANFGLDPNESKQVEYLSTWYTTRFARLFLIYCDALKKVTGQPFEKGENITEDQADTVLKTFKVNAAAILITLDKLTPSKIAYLAIMVKGQAQNTYKPNSLAAAVRRDPVGMAWDKASLAKKEGSNPESPANQPAAQTPPPPVTSGIAAAAAATNSAANTNTPTPFARPSGIAAVAAMTAAATSASAATQITPNGAMAAKFPAAANGNGVADVKASGAAAPGDGSLGSLSAKYESGSRGSMAIGWDSTGGTSYGKYQIASRTGTMTRFVKWVSTQGENGAAVAQALTQAGALDTGSKNGQAPAVWQQLVRSGTMGDLEHKFIKESHYDPAYRKLPAEARQRIDASKALQDVLWSTAVQHGPGGASKIFTRTFNPQEDNETFLRKIYADRATKFGSSTDAVRASVQNRFRNELSIALGMLKNDKPGAGGAPQGQSGSPAVAAAGGSGGDQVGGLGGGAPSATAPSTPDATGGTGTTAPALGGAAGAGTAVAASGPGTTAAPMSSAGTTAGASGMGGGSGGDSVAINSPSPSMPSITGPSPSTAVAAAAPAGAPVSDPTLASIDATLKSVAQLLTQMLGVNQAAYSDQGIMGKMQASLAGIIIPEQNGGNTTVVPVTNNVMASQSGRQTLGLNLSAGGGNPLSLAG